MPRSPPRSEVVFLNGDRLRLARKRTVKEGSTKYKGVNMVCTNIRYYKAYTTIKGIKTYIGKYSFEFDAAVAIALAKKNGVENPPSPKARAWVGKDELSPLHGMDDKEASRLASPVSYPASPLQPFDLDQATLRGRAHKSLLDSYYEAHGKPFEPTPKASTIRIPYFLPSRTTRSRQDN